MARSSETDAFWQAFRHYIGLEHDNYVVGSFGDSPEMATKLTDLVIARTERATASLARDYGEGRDPIPKPGDFAIILDGEGRPQFIWRTTEVTIKPLSQVDEALLGTRVKGTARETGGSMLIAGISPGRPAVKDSEFDGDIPTVFERFEVVWPIAVADVITGATSASTQ